MATWIKIAALNLLRNGRRSLFTISAIGIGFAAVVVFGGFIKYIFAGLEDSHIYSQGNGHLAIFKQGFLAKGKLDPAGYLLDESDVARIRDALKSFADVEIVTPQLHISGLLSNGDVSVVMFAFGRVPSDVAAIRNHGKGWVAKLDLFTGKPLQDDISYGVGLSVGLAKELELGLGSDAIAVAPTINGQMNALDVHVFQLFDTGVEVLNDTVMAVPLKLAQSLYDTAGVERVAVLLEGSQDVGAARDAFLRALRDRGLEVEIKTWRELEPAYTKVEEMFNLIFIFIFIIMLIIVVMSVVNTMTMAVVERTREIGTLRALGVKRSGIVKLFAVESALLGALGCLLGMILTGIGWLMVSVVLKPTWVPPLVTKRVPLQFYIVPEYIAYAALLLILLSMLAAIFPARRAARLEVIDALGHV
jgi:putative ABC transport system permease protein